MQGTPIENSTHKTELESYKQWLERLGYAKSTVYSYHRLAKQFLDWNHSNGQTLETFTSTDLLAYEAWLNQKPNCRRGGGLSIVMIRSSLQVLHNFAEYLLYQEGLQIPVPDLSSVSLKQRIFVHYAILTQAEIHQLYQTADNSARGRQDRAMLSLYYGCGLRRKEGLQLQKEDIDWKRNYLHVRKGKGGKDRIIPFTSSVRDDLKAVVNEETNRLLPCCGQTVLSRIKKLADRAGIDKEVTVHGLRHSIATHLLQQGMPLEQIRIFLGHSSLETTQIYTHLVAEHEGV